VPGARIDASVRAASEQDAEAIPDLIELLDSQDPATRLIASNAIQWIIGKPIDYDHGAPLPDRLAAVDRLRIEYEEGRLVPEAIAGSASATSASEPTSDPDYDSEAGGDG